MALIMSVLVVIPLGLFIAYRQETFVDRTAVAGSSLLLAVPGFVLAIVLLTIFGINWDILPVSGWVPISENLAQNLQHALLPAIVLAVGESVVLLPVLRSDVINTLQQEYNALARAKGLNPSRILFRHALRPSSISLITLLGLTLARLIGGTVIVESIFALPGVGSLLVQSIETKDLVAVQGIVMFIAIVYLITNFVVDVLYTRLDPRVALQ
jgi:peptide/nickel transport system permease protein